jgi:DNA-binding GntR family transcriptional regulator
VFAWLKEHPGSRTREVIAQFTSDLSGRTVKRALKDLVQNGVLHKREEAGSVSYEVVETA